ncbi:MAG: hypothetical protein JSS96_00415 [Bacteroidetes bacterium]|nr:hypothetical protein [Bacteroidota bacterium]
MSTNKNQAMIARLLVGIGLRTYLASGSLILYVRKKRNSLQQNAKHIKNNAGKTHGKLAQAK